MAAVARQRLGRIVEIMSINFYGKHRRLRSVEVSMSQLKASFSKIVAQWNKLESYIYMIYYFSHTEFSCQYCHRCRRDAQLHALVYNFL